ncbi:MAG: M16 family metallopeptidase [Candidatus Cloacimonadaceae bacterium]|jgi:zinc protease
MNPLKLFKPLPAKVMGSTGSPDSHSFEIQKAQKYVHPNGLSYYLYSDTSEPIVCLQAVVKTGSTIEQKGQAGYSHFIEHLTFKSSKNYGFNEISNTVFALGGWLNAYTDFDSTCYYMLLPSEQVFIGLQILGELLMNASFNAEDVETEKDIILEEMLQYRDDPEADFLEHIQLSYFDKSPLGRSIIGNPESIKAATHARLKSFYKRRYQPQNSFVVVSGAVEADVLHKYMDDIFGKWQNRNSPLKKPINRWLEPEISKKRYVWQKAEQNLFAWVLPELSELNPAADHLLFAIRYLAIGRSSKLHKILVEDKKLCSAIRVYSLCGLDSGASVVTFVTSRKSAIPKIASIIRQNFSDLWHNGIDPEEFELIRSDIIHGWLYGFEARESIGNYIVAEALLGDYERLYSYGERIKAVTAQQVEAAVKKYWQPRFMTFYYRGGAAVELDPTLIPGHKDYILPPKKRKKQTAATEAPQIIFHTKRGEQIKTESQSPSSQELVQVDEKHWQGILPNGIHFTFKQLYSNPVSGFTLCTPASQLWESAEQRGFNYFLSTMLLYQSANYSHQSIMDFSRKLGMNIRVTHSLDTTSYKGKCFTADLAPSLTLLADLLSNISLDSSYLSTLKSAASDNLRREKDHPATNGYLKWLRTIFANSQVLERSSGNISQIKQIKTTHLESWFEEHYRAQNFHLAICASMDAETVWEMVNQIFDSIPSFDQQPEKLRLQLTPQKPSKKRSMGANEQAVIHLGSLSCSSKDKVQTTAAHLLAQIIGGDVNSRFFDIVREKHGLAYQTGMELVNLESVGYWTAYAFCNPKEQKLCLKLMQDILKDIHQNGVEPQELELAKNYLIGMHRFDAESVNYQASSLAALSALGYDIQHHLQRSNRITSIDIETVDDYAKQYLNPQNLYIHILK